MLRRSIAVAGPSVAAVSSSSIRAAALVHPGCLLCTRSFPGHISAAEASSSVTTLSARQLTSSALASRQRYKSGFVQRPRSRERVSRWGESEHAPAHGKGRGAKYDRSHGKKAGKHKDIDFSAPEPPTAQHVARRLRETLSTMAENPDLPSQLVAYGVAGKPAQLLLQRYGEAHETSSEKGRSTPTKAKDAFTAIQLFQTWSEEAQDAIPDLAVLHDAGKPTHAEIFTHLSDAVSSFAIEGEKCLGRFCVSGFLDWVDRGLEALHATSTSETLQTDSSLTPAEAAEVSLARSQLSLLRSCMDLRFPVYRYPFARTLTRNIHLHVGPTNSGKTHGALVALSKARTGIFAGPLRLLAHEVWDRFNNGTISPGVAARACNLITGEEQRLVDPMAGLVSCTVEMVSQNRSVDVGVVDEIQMIGDPQRGYAWTDAVLGLPAKELHLCGEASVIPLIQSLAKACGDHLTIHRYDRLTPLTLANESLNNDLSAIQKGDCIVAFSRTAIFALKREIEKKTGLRCAVAYGALPPETKSEQAKLFNEGKLDVMVASDAIGMGLNLRIKRIVFDTLTKWNGKEEVTLSASQIKQIAGRAGRYGTQDKETKKADLGGVVTTRHEHELEILRAALASPLLPIRRAAIQPSSETFVQLSAVLPNAHGANSTKRGLRTLSEIYADVSLLARIDSANFFLSDLSSQLAISPLVESSSAGLLTVSERETFSNAPVNTRDERVTAFLCKAVAQFSRGALVQFDTAAKDLSMLETEEEITTLMHQAIAARDRSAHSNPNHAKAKAEAEAADPLPLIAYLHDIKTMNGGGLTGGSAAHPLINITTLLVLESLHRCFTLYLWLSFRFPLAFCYRAEVDARKKVAEEAIDFVLQGIRFGRTKRLQALGRPLRSER